MKRLLSLLVIGSLFAHISCDSDNDPDSKGLDANSYRLSKLVHYSSSTSSTPIRGVEYSYNVSGTLLKESHYDYSPSKTLSMYKEYDYAGDKKIREKIYGGMVGNLTLGLYINYHYLNDKIIKEETFRGSDNLLINSVTFEFDKDNLVKQQVHEHESGIVRETKYTYDNENRLILVEFTEFEYAYVKHLYDTNGREFKTECYDSSGSLLFYSEKKYDGSSKHPSTELQFSKDGSQHQKYTYLYDKWGNLVEVIINDGCSLFHKKYNGDLLVESISYDLTGGCAEGTMTKYEYEEVKK